jgi:hypothetical protein
MGPITALIPVPRECTLAGTPVLVSEARLRDLATLQGHLDDEAPDPLANLPAILAEEDETVRQRMLVTAYKTATRDALIYGEPSGSLVFRATDEGLCLFLWVALQRHQPHLSIADVVKLAVKMRDGEFDRIYRIFHGVKAWKVLERLIMGEEAPAPPRSRAPILWPEAIDEVARERGWTYAQIYDLTITEWVNVRREGKPEVRGRKLKPGEDPLQALSEMRRRFGAAPAEHN